eukprot:659762-Prymnesium_polylepis.1
MASGTLDEGYSRTFQIKLLDLRTGAAAIRDELSGRMPLAYTHLMQLLVDLLVIFTPFALLSSVSGLLPAVVGTGAVTLFYSSLLLLAKMFCDPYDNEQFGGQKYGIAINVDCLLQETNSNSERWRRGAVWVPALAR